jgi:hypothetical protein
LLDSFRLIDAKEAHDFTSMRPNGRKQGIAFCARIRYNFSQEALDTWASHIIFSSLYQSTTSERYTGKSSNSSVQASLAARLPNWTQNGLVRIESRRSLLLIHREDTRQGQPFGL